MRFLEYFFSQGDHAIHSTEWRKTVAPHVYEDAKGYCRAFLFGADITLGNVRKFFPSANMEESSWPTRAEGLPPYTHLIFRDVAGERFEISELARISSYRSFEEINVGPPLRDWPEGPVATTGRIEYHLCFPNGEYEVGQVVPVLEIWLGNKHYEGSLAQRILAALKNRANKQQTLTRP